jgi:hypothetical protein
MWNDIIHSIIPAITLLATGIVGAIVSKVKTKLEENTTITRDGNDDLSKGFKEMGQWRYATEKQLAIMAEKLAHLENSNEDVKRRVERIPTTSQVAYRRTQEEPPE